MIHDKVNYILSNMTNIKLGLEIRRLQSRYEDLEDKSEHYYSLDLHEQESYYDEYRDLHIEQKAIVSRIDAIYETVVKRLGK